MLLLQLIAKMSLCVSAKFCCDCFYGCRVIANEKFLNTAPVCHLEFAVRRRGTTNEVQLGLYHCTKFDSNRFSSFDNTEV